MRIDMRRVKTYYLRRKEAKKMPNARDGIFVVLPAVLARHKKALRAIQILPKVLPVVVCVGDGTQNSDRELLALQTDVQGALADKTRELRVIIPNVDVEEPASRLSGDNMIPLFYGDFEEFHILTVKDWVKGKRKKFTYFPMVQVFGFRV